MSPLYIILPNYCLELMIFTCKSLSLSSFKSHWDANTSTKHIILLDYRFCFELHCFGLAYQMQKYHQCILFFDAVCLFYLHSLAVKSFCLYYPFHPTGIHTFLNTFFHICCLFAFDLLAFACEFMCIDFSFAMSSRF